MNAKRRKQIAELIDKLNTILVITRSMAEREPQTGYAANLDDAADSIAAAVNELYSAAGRGEAA